MSMTEKELARIEGKLEEHVDATKIASEKSRTMEGRIADDVRHSLMVEIFGWVPSLISEVRELQKLIGKPWVEVTMDGPTVERVSREAFEALREKIAGLDDSLLAMTVERDNLRKMAADWEQKAQHNYEVAEQERKWREEEAERIKKIEAVVAAAKTARAAWIHHPCGPKILQAFAALEGILCAEHSWLDKEACRTTEVYCIHCGEIYRPPVPMCKDPLDSVFLDSPEGRPT